jgi:hypothetical protein
MEQQSPYMQQYVLSCGRLVLLDSFAFCFDLVTNCGNPGIPHNGQKQGSNYEYGRSVVFTCNTGYTMAGSAVGDIFP